MEKTRGQFWNCRRMVERAVGPKMTSKWRQGCICSAGQVTLYFLLLLKEIRSNLHNVNIIECASVCLGGVSLGDRLTECAFFPKIFPQTTCPICPIFWVKLKSVYGFFPYIFQRPQVLFLFNWTGYFGQFDSVCVKLTLVFSKKKKSFYIRVWRVFR